jgi:hypothetical protein
MEFFMGDAQMTTDELLAWMEAQPGADLLGPNVTVERVWRARCERGRASAPTIIEAIRKLKKLLEQEGRP